MKLFLNFSPYAKLGSGTWVDVSDAILDKGFSRKSCFGAKGEAEMQTASVTLRPVVGLQPLLLQIITSTSDVRAKLTLDDDTPYFIGTIRPMLSASVKEMVKPFTVEILDDSYFLESYVFDEASTLSANLKVISSTPADSLFHWLVLQSRMKSSGGTYVCPFSASDVLIDGDVDLSVTADGLILNPGDYIDDILETVCYEYGLQYRFNAEGEIVVQNSLPDTVASPSTLEDKDILNSLTVKRGDDSTEGVVVTYYPVVKGPCKVARHNIMDTRWADDKTFGRGYEWLNPDEVVYPPAQYQKVTLSGADLDNYNREILRYDLTTLKPRIEFHESTKDSSQSIAKYSPDGDGYKLWIQVAKRKTLVKELYLMCDCWYIDKEDERTTQVHQGRNPEKYEAKYIHSGTVANRLLKAIALRNSTGNTTYSFQVMSSKSLAPGEIYKLESVAYGVSDHIRILSVTDSGDSKSTNLKQVEAESITALEDLELSYDEQVVSYLTRTSKMLEITPPFISAFFDESEYIQFTAFGDAISKYGATLKWYLGELDLHLSEETIYINHQVFELGENVVRVEAEIDGIDFGDKPLDAESVVTMLPKPEDGLPGQDAISVQIFSTNGNIFRDGTAYTTMRAIVFRGDQDITDEIDESLFNWERVSGDSAADESWNTSSKAVGRKTVEITPSDVLGRTVFACHIDI